MAATHVLRIPYPAPMSALVLSISSLLWSLGVNVLHFRA